MKALFKTAKGPGNMELREVPEPEYGPGEVKLRIKVAGICGSDLHMIDGIEMVDQNPIGKSSRSNPVTYLKAWDEIRKLFAEQQSSVIQGLATNAVVRYPIAWRRSARVWTDSGRTPRSRSGVSPPHMLPS